MSQNKKVPQAKAPDAPVNPVNKIAPSSMEAFGTIPDLVKKITSGETSLHDVLDKIECAILIEVIDKCKDNHTQAAKMLGINRTTFVMKLRKLRSLGINPAVYRYKDQLQS